MPGGLGCNGKLGSLTTIGEDGWRGRNDTPVVTVVRVVPPRVITGTLSGEGDFFQLDRGKYRDKTNGFFPPFCDVVSTWVNWMN
jgi:hypothetical protein